MNATEARKVADNNRHKVAERQLEEAIKVMEEKIMLHAELGYHSATIEVMNRGPWIFHDCTEKFKEYFESKGFKVAKWGWGRVEQIKCSW